MASVPHTDDNSLRAVAHSAPGRWARWLLPSYSDNLFLAVLVWLFATGSGGWLALLSDGDSGWHIRTGDWILRHGRVPTVDLFSFSKSGQPWFAWEWLTDVVYSLLHSTFGLKGLLLFSALIIAGSGTVLFRHMLWRGTAPFVALAASLVVFGASSIHYLARPHVVTLLGMAIAMWMIDADRRSPSNRIWLLIPITALWVNLHGGYLAVIACAGLLFVGTAIEQFLALGARGPLSEWRPSMRYGALMAGCGAASLINPYGVRLHVHIYEYLRSDWIKNNIQEFQSPVFRSETMLQFEGMLFAGLITAGWLISRRRVVPALWILFWGHSSLGSARHVPLFMIISAPWIAEGLTALWDLWTRNAHRASVAGILASLNRDMVPNCARTSVWLVVAVAAFAMLDESVVRWPKDYPDVKFPANMVARHGERLASARVLTMDQWADYLIYRQYPRQKVYVDGRSDFFGKEIGDEYIQMTQGHWKWESLVSKNGFNLVLSPVAWPLATLLKSHRDWRVVDDDGQAVLFERVANSER